MIKIVNGNILDATEEIIVHQVNCRKVMNGGLAKQIRLKFPEVYKAYCEICGMYKPEDLLGRSQIIDCKNNKLVVNLFGQLNYGRDKQYTDYKALFEGLDSVYNAVKNIKKYKGKTVAIPYGIGCGLGGGDWNVVYKIIEEVFDNYDVTIYKLELRKEK